MGALEVLRESIQDVWEDMLEGQGDQAAEFLNEVERRVEAEGINGLRCRHRELDGSIFDFRKPTALVVTNRFLPDWAVFVMVEVVGHHLQVRRLVWYEKMIVDTYTRGVDEARGMTKIVQLHIDAIRKELRTDGVALSRTGKWFLEYW